MPPIRADLSKSSGFETVPAGQYLAVSSLSKTDVSTGPKTSGATTLNVRFKLNDGGSVFENFIIHPSTLWKFKMFVIAAGLDPAELDVPNAVIGFRHELEDFEISDDETPVYLDDILSEVIGQQVLIDVTVEPGGTDSTGRTYPERNRIGKISSANDVSDSGTGW